MSGNVTAHAVAVLQATLRDDDWALLNHFQASRLLSGGQFRRLMATGSESDVRQLRRQLARLERKRIVSRLGRRVGGVRAGSDSFVWALDVAGQRLTEPTPRHRWRRPWTPSLRTLAHSLAVSELYVTLIEAERASHIELLDYAVEPPCWRRFVGPGGARMTLKPDAHVVLARGEIEVHAWVEMDMATESLRAITDKAKVYAAYFRTGKEQATEGVFPRCLWLAPDQTRAAGLVDALSRLPAEQWQLHHVATQQHALAALLATSQQLTGGTRT